MNNFIESAFEAVIGKKGIAFLDTQIANNFLFYLDYWNFLHFGAGMIFGYLWPEKYKMWIVIMVVLELLELFMVGTYYKNHYVLTDSFWDFVIGAAGFLLMSKTARQLVGGWVK